MIIRPATLSDFNAVLALVSEYTPKYDKLRPDTDRMRYVFNMLVSAKSHFAEVVEDDAGVVQGAILALGSDNLWATKRNCAVLFWVSRVPGAGVKMLRNLVKWWDSRPIYRVLGFSPDLDVDERVWVLVERMGFARSGGLYLKYRG